jgi:hypothetical protein
VALVLDSEKKLWGNFLPTPSRIVPNSRCSGTKDGFWKESRFFPKAPFEDLQQSLDLYGGHEPHFDFPRLEWSPTQSNFFSSQACLLAFSEIGKSFSSKPDKYFISSPSPSIQALDEEVLAGGSISNTERKEGHKRNNFQ